MKKAIHIFRFLCESGFVMLIFTILLESAQPISAQTTYTATSTGDINAALTWSPYITVDLPVAGDANIWSTGTFSLKVGLANTSVYNFNGGTLIIASGGILQTAFQSPTLMFNNLTLNGGKILVANNNGLTGSSLSFNLDLQGNTFTLNSGSIVTTTNLTGTPTFKNCSLAGSGTITVAQTGIAGTAVNNWVDFQSTVTTNGFTGQFIVSPGTTGTYPGAALKISATTSGTFGISVPAANASNGVLLNGVSYKSSVNGKLYFTPASGTLTLASLNLGGVDVAPGTYGLTAGTGITAFTASQLNYIDGRSMGKVVVLESVKPPTGVVATVGNTQTSVAFTAPVITSGSPIIDYTATAYNDGVLVSSVTGTASPLVLTGLTNGVNYAYYVSARSNAGNSVSVLATVPNLVPIQLATPTLLASTNILPSGFTANWTSVPNATGYLISVYLNNYLVKADSTSGKTSTNYVFSGNSVGYSYTYQISAKGDGIRYSNSNVSSMSAPVKTFATMIVLAKILSNNMVLQQDTQAALWGWGAPNDVISITSGWGATATATVDTNGKWSTTIQTPKATTGQAPVYTLTFTGPNNTVVLSNILIGDVWLCSGQSNMCLGLGAATNGAAEVAAANYPTMRLIQVGDDIDQNVQNNSTSAAWSACTPSSVGGFTAVGYFFGRELINDPNINIPIGIIRSAVGGSNCQSWVRNEALVADPLLKSTFVDPYTANPNSSSYASNQQKPSWCYNGMIAPIIPLSMKGVVWYQGEGNASIYSSYKQLWGTMIQDWRSLNGSGNIPFYYVQLPNYTTTDPWANMREAQTGLLTLNNVGMAVSLDVGDNSNIHPTNKYPVGKRLALWARAKTYGENIVYSGPMFKSSTIVNNTIVISFLAETLGSGLISGDGTALKGFQIAGADNILYDATATISGNTVVVTSPNVTVPTKVWYAFSNTPLVNLTNAEGLPACPFRTDTWDSNIVLTQVRAVGTKTAYFNVQGKTLKTPEIGAIQLFDLQGRRLIEAKGVQSLNTNLANGMYIACFSNESGNSFSEKVIIGGE